MGSERYSTIEQNFGHAFVRELAASSWDQLQTGYTVAGNKILVTWIWGVTYSLFSASRQQLSFESNRAEIVKVNGRTFLSTTDRIEHFTYTRRIALDSKGTAHAVIYNVKLSEGVELTDAEGKLEDLWRSEKEQEQTVVVGKAVWRSTLEQ